MPFKTENLLTVCALKIQDHAAKTLRALCDTIDAVVNAAIQEEVRAQLAQTDAARTASVEDLKANVEALRQDIEEGFAALGSEEKAAAQEAAMDALEPMDNQTRELLQKVLERERKQPPKPAKQRSLWNYEDSAASPLPRNSLGEAAIFYMDYEYNGTPKEPEPEPEPSPDVQGSASEDVELTRDRMPPCPEVQVTGDLKRPVGLLIAAANNIVGLTMDEEKGTKWLEDVSRRILYDNECGQYRGREALTIAALAYGVTVDEATVMPRSYAKDLRPVALKRALEYARGVACKP